jgi:diguanylate cyclase (GGDEF)-like protein/PAS domain S-box-containing protein
MPRFSLRTLLPIIVTAVFVLVAVAALGTSKHLLLAQTEAEAVQHLRNRLHTTQGTLERFLMLGHPEGVRKVISASGSDLDLGVQFATDQDGLVVASTNYREVNAPWTALRYGIDPDTVRDVTQRRISRVANSPDGRWLNGYISICDPGSGGRLRASHCGFLFHQVDLDHHREQVMTSITRQAWILAGGFAASALLLILVVDRLATSRVARLVAVIGRYGDGERAARARFTGRDEFARLGQQVDQLLDRLAADEATLREGEQVKRAIIDSANAAIISTAPNGLLQTFSAGAERMLGYRAGELVGAATPTLFHDPHELAGRAARLSHELGREVTPGIDVLVARASLGEHDEHEWTYIRRDGTRLTVDLSMTALVGENGDITGFVGIARDITEEKASVQRLRLAERVFEGAGEAIVVTDPDTRIVDVNPAYLESTGYSRDEVIGATPKLAASGRHKQTFYREMWGALERTGRWSGELWDRRKNGDVFPQWLTVNAIKDDDGKVTHYVGIFKDVTQQKAVEEKLQRMAYYDPLTELPNRALFRDRLEHEIELAERSRTRVALLFLDLDQFKYVNDTLGHDAGDQLLVEAAKRIRACVRQSDTIARLGGDEFTLILANVGDTARVGDVADKVIHALQMPFRLGNSEVFIGASIGISVYPDDGTDFVTLTKNADAAMYQAKHAGRRRHRFFTPALNDANARRVQLESHLRSALQRDEFQLLFQPKLALDSAEVLGFEALLRWHSPALGLVEPDECIPLAEDTGLIVDIGNWVLERACTTLKHWHDAGYDDLQMAVNLTARQFRHEALVADVNNILHRLELDPSRLELELTESLLMNDVDRSVQVTGALRDLGVQVSVDDFGTGYSSLSYLKRLPIQTLKIDRSFVDNVTENPDDMVIVRAILSLGTQLDLQVVAEGVETRVQHDLLRAEGCRLAQGHYFAPALSSEDALSFLQRRRGARLSAVRGDPVGT